MTDRIDRLVLDRTETLDQVEGVRYWLTIVDDKEGEDGNSIVLTKSRGFSPDEMVQLVVECYTKPGLDVATGRTAGDKTIDVTQLVAMARALLAAGNSKLRYCVVAVDEQMQLGAVEGNIPPDKVGEIFETLATRPEAIAVKPNPSMVN